MRERVGIQRDTIPGEPWLSDEDIEEIMEWEPPLEDDLTVYDLGKHSGDKAGV